MASLRVLFGFYYGCNQVSSEVVSVGGFWDISVSGLGGSAYLRVQHEGC